MPRLSQAQIGSVIEVLQPAKPLAVYVFGSYGTSRQHPGSDLDLAILSNLNLGPVETFKLSNQLSELLGLQTDLIELSTASAVMRKEVLRTGELLQAADRNAARQFEMLTLAEYARLNEERSEILLSQ